MGMQTTVIIRNDGLWDIKKNPQQFVDNLFDAIQRIGSGLDQDGIDIAAGSHGNPARVVETHHSDSTTVVASGGSTARVLGTVYKWAWPNEEAMKDDLIKAIKGEE